MGFNDVFSKVKKGENSEALDGLGLLLSNLDKLEKSVMVETLIENILAGNMYDWYLFYLH